MGPSAQAVSEKTSGMPTPEAAVPSRARRTFGNPKVSGSYWLLCKLNFHPNKLCLALFYAHWLFIPQMHFLFQFLQVSFSFGLTLPFASFTISG